MSELIYEKAKNRLDNFITLVGEFAVCERSSFEISEKYKDIIDPLKCMVEFDKLKMEFPDTYKIYLDFFLTGYNFAETMLNKSSRSNDELGEIIEMRLYNYLKSSIDHLKGMLNHEPKIQEQSNPITNPKVKSILTREQITLLFWYLRERELIDKLTNENIAYSINILTGYSKKQIQDIIKSPGMSVTLLGKGNDKINRHDFKTVISELKKLVEKMQQDLEVNTNNGELR